MPAKPESPKRFSMRKTHASRPSCPIHSTNSASLKRRVLRFICLLEFNSWTVRRKLVRLTCSAETFNSRDGSHSSKAATVCGSLLGTISSADNCLLDPSCQCRSGASKQLICSSVAAKYTGSLGHSGTKTSGSASRTRARSAGLASINTTSRSRKPSSAAKLAI